MRRPALSGAKTLLLYHRQKWIPSRTVKGPTIKLSEDNIWEHQCNLKVGKNFFFLVLPLYCYQPISPNPRAHMLSHVIPWTSAHQAPLSMDFSRQEYWSGLPFPSPGKHFLTKKYHALSKKEKKLRKWTALLLIFIY